METPASSLQRLPLELRIAIYAHVFGTSQVIKPSSSDTVLGIYKEPFGSIVHSHAPQPAEVQLHTSILATSKTIFLEAISVLYFEKTIRGSLKDLRQLLHSTGFTEHVRRIEVAGGAGYFQVEEIHSILLRLQVLPQVPSLIILSDCLGLADGKASGGTTHVTVPEFASMAELGKVTCTDIGQYQIHGMFKRWKFVNRRLTKMWNQVETTPDDYNAFDDLAAVMSKWPLEGNAYDWVAWAAQTSLRLWVGLHDFMLCAAISGDIEELRRTPETHIFRELERYAWTTRPFCYDARKLIDGAFVDVRKLNRWFLRGLKAGDDQDTLLWATEYLAVNIATYTTWVDRRGRQEWNAAQSSWSEVDGSLDTIEYHARNQDFAKDGLVNPLYFDRRGLLVDRAAAYAWLHLEQDALAGIWTPVQRQDYSRFSGPELKQVTYLCMALHPHGMGRPNAAELEEHDRWSSGILKRYFCVKGSIRYCDLLHVPTSDLRRVLRVVLSVLACQEKRTRCRIPDHLSTIPPRGFDGEVFHPFAGQYSALLERAWKEYMVTPGATSMDIG